MQPKKGILVVGHGTSSCMGTAEFAKVVSGLRANFPATPLAFGFLEHAKPTIEQAVEVLFSKGVTSILVAPLLLFSAGHAKTDIPAEVQRATSKRGMEVAGQADVLGLHPQIIALSLRRFAEVTETQTPEVAFVLVGRGSRDPEAQLAAVEFVEACKASAGLAIARLGFLAMAKPDISEELGKLGREEIPQVVVVPHLLFQGDLAEKCHRLVSESAVRFPKTKWLLASRLGPDAAVVSAAADRIRAKWK